MGCDEQDAPQRYAAGLRSIAIRSLTIAERRAIRRRLVRAWSMLVLAAIGILGAYGFALLFDGRLNAAVLHQVGGPFGVAMCFTGLWGTIGAVFSERRSWRMLAVAGIAYLLGTTGLSIVGPQLPRAPFWLTWSVVVGTALVGNAYATVGLWQRIRLVRRGRAIRRDIERDRVETFEGPLSGRASDETLRRLCAAGYVEREGVAPRLEILPESGLVLRVNERSLDRVELVHVVEVAPSAPHALRVALPEGLVRGTAPTKVSLQRRSLTPAERRELANHIHRLRRRWWAPFIVTVAVGVVVGFRLQEGLGWQRMFEGIALGWYALAGMTYVSYARRWIAARKLEDDRNLRWVVTVEDETEVVGAKPPKLEVLPISQLAWTENATPAGWRVHRL